MSNRPTRATLQLLPLAQLPWLRRTLARGLCSALSCLHAQHRPSWLLGHASGTGVEAQADAVQAAYEQGLADGYAHALAEHGLTASEASAHATASTALSASTIAETLPAADSDAQPSAAASFDPSVESEQAAPDQPAESAESATAALFDATRLPITAALKRRIKADVAARLPATAQPSTAQWKLIFSDTATTCVVAGAGAGKSTSLVLRVLVLHHYLGYTLDSLTVVTFTRESRQDFIQRLCQVYALWQLPLTPAQARERVRTFHSRILPLVRQLPGMAHVRAFETLGDKAHSDEDTSTEGNPFDLRLNPSQRQLLNQCYAALLQTDATFATLIDQLRAQALQLRALDSQHPEVQKRVQVIQLAAQRDEELCDAVEDLWYAAGAWPVPGIEPCRETLTIRGHRFHVQGRLGSAGPWVILGFDPGESPRYQRPGAKLSVRAEWAVKRTLLQAFSDRPLIWLDSYASARELGIALAGDATAGPGFEYKVQGEAGAAPLLDAFVSAATFMENLGLDAAGAASALRLPEHDGDALFFAALARYWPALQTFLLQQSPPVMSYNQMFAQFSEHQHDTLARLPEPLLVPFTHLMIDEFQDISPQIVSWLRGMMGELQRRRNQGALAVGGPGTLMGVGDDWQSIYGWRGSAPHYFLHFEQTFPAPSHTRVALVDNFRSQPLIIEAAEQLVKGVSTLPGKRARASGAAAELPRLPVIVRERDDARLAECVAEHLANEESVLILSRKSSDKLLIEKALYEELNVDSRSLFASRRLRMMTFHSAKGLQADTVMLVGDCTYQGTAPYKNQLYRLASLGDSARTDAYDHAQYEEAQRLAYVGVTRTIRHCYWYLEPSQGEAGGVKRASERIDARLPCFDDQRPTGRTT